MEWNSEAKKFISTNSLGYENNMWTLGAQALGRNVWLMAYEILLMRYTSREKTYSSFSGSGRSKSAYTLGSKAINNQTRSSKMKAISLF